MYLVLSKGELYAYQCIAILKLEKVAIFKIAKIEKSSDFEMTKAAKSEKGKVTIFGIAKGKIGNFEMAKAEKIAILLWQKRQNRKT